MSDNADRLVIIRNLGWMKRQRSRFAGQDRQSKRSLSAGETRFLFGRRYRLETGCRMGLRVWCFGERPASSYHVRANASVAGT